MVEAPILVAYIKPPLPLVVTMLIGRVLCVFVGSFCFVTSVETLENFISCSAEIQVGKSFSTKTVYLIYLGFGRQGEKVDLVGN